MLRASEGVAGKRDVLTISNPGCSLRCAAARLTALAVVLGCTVLTANLAQAQQYTPPPPPLTSAPCVPTKKDPCTIPAGDQVPAAPAATQFPFPGDAPAAGSAAQKFPYPGESPAATSPSGAAPATSPTKFPYPGDPAAPAAGAGSSSSSSSSSTPDGAAPADSAPAPLSRPATRTGRRPLPKVENQGEREAEDLDVSKFYIQTGNYVAAYNRAKDALRIMPDDSEAHWALAVAAQKMKKPDEAVAEYNAYLKADPDGTHAKTARAALTELSSGK